MAKGMSGSTAHFFKTGNAGSLKRGGERPPIVRHLADTETIVFPAEIAHQEEPKDRLTASIACFERLGREVRRHIPHTASHELHVTFEVNPCQT